MAKHMIPDDEYSWRWKRTQEGIRKRGLDFLLAHSNEADFANVRYLSDYWPIFETAGVLVPPQGEPALLIGPESETYARDRSRLSRIYKLIEYRESAEPEYPDIRVDTYKSVVSEMLPGREIKRIGLAGYQILPMPVYDGLRGAFPDAEILKADDVLVELRTIKRPVEIDMLQEGFRISEIALGEALRKMRPEMTELQVVGILEEALYANGAEFEAHPQYVLAGRNSSHAIGRPGYGMLGTGNLIQLNVGGRFGGYSPSVGRPVCIGKMPPDMRRLVQAGLDLHFKTMEWMKEGVIAKHVVAKFFEYADQLGVTRNILYGPCHGLGMMEVEKPWMESNSDYALQANMTFQVDTFLYCADYGLRWENGVRVTKDGVEPFSSQYLEIIEL